MRTISNPELAGHLRLVIARTARRLRQEAGVGLSPTLTAALSTVERHGPLTPSELAARERIQRPTATRLLARLEEMGLIERTPDPQDRRSSLLSTTASGAALLAAVRERKDAYLAQRLDTLSPEELATLQRAAGMPYANGPLHLGHLAGRGSDRADHGGDQVVDHRVERAVDDADDRAQRAEQPVGPFLGGCARGRGEEAHDDPGGGEARTDQRGAQERHPAHRHGLPHPLTPQTYWFGPYLERGARVHTSHGTFHSRP